MTQNTTGVSLAVTKDPQCRHSEKQGFVSYDSRAYAGGIEWRASCSNCGSVGPFVRTTVIMSDELRKDAARNALMLIEADEL